MLKKLDEILLSENACQNFNREYNSNKSFKKWILSILPEIEECKKQVQDNPWHIYNCLDHILHSVEEINKQTANMDYGTKRMLAYTMFLHDIGKPECHIRRYSQLYQREVDSFFKHNEASKKIAARVLANFNFNEKEIEIIKKLIEEHDMFMFITLEPDQNSHHRTLSYGLVKKYIEFLSAYGDGKVLLKYLTLVGKADSRAQNPEMTASTLKMISKMQNMIENVKIINGEKEL